MNMDVVENLFPELHEVHMEFYDKCKDTLRSKLDALLHEHLAMAGFILKTDVEELLHDVSDVAKSLCTELSVQLYDPATEGNLRAVAYVDSEIADEDTFALDTAMGIALYRVLPGTYSKLTWQPIASAGAVAYSAKSHQAPAHEAFAELAKLNVAALSNVIQDELTP